MWGWGKVRVRESGGIEEAKEGTELIRGVFIDLFLRKREKIVQFL